MNKKSNIVTYGEEGKSTQVYSSDKIDKAISKIQKSSELSRKEASQQFLESLIDDPRVSLIEFGGMTFTGTRLQDHYFQERSLNLSFYDCKFEGDVAFQDFSKLAFYWCEFSENKGVGQSSFDALADHIVLDQCRLKRRDMDLMATGRISLLHCNHDDPFSDCRLQTPHLYLNDSHIFYRTIDYYVERLEQGPVESTLGSSYAYYFGDFVYSDMSEDFISFVISKEHDIERLKEQYRLMEIAKFLDCQGRRLAKEAHRRDEIELLCQNLQKVENSDLKSVFQVLNQPSEVSSMEELQNLTPVQLVKRMQRGK